MQSNYFIVQIKIPGQIVPLLITQIPSPLQRRVVFANTDTREDPSRTMDYYDELLTTTEHLTDLTTAVTDSISGDMETTTLGNVFVPSRVLGLYDIFIPLLGVFIIVLNLGVVVSSGLILKKGE